MIIDPVALIKQTFREVLPNKFDSPAAAIMLIAIGLQESLFVYRSQIGGPARGFWQFERGGGVKGVLLHQSTSLWAEVVCLVRRVPVGADPIYNKLSTDDVLACAFARLLLYSDPFPLPATSEEGWKYYLRNWRPGKPHPDVWPANYAKAVSLIP